MTRRVQSATAALIVTYTSYDYIYYDNAYWATNRLAANVLDRNTVCLLGIVFFCFIFIYTTHVIITSFVRDNGNNNNHHYYALCVKRILLSIEFTITPLEINLETALLTWGELNKNKFYPHVVAFGTLVNRITGSTTSKLIIWWTQYKIFNLNNIV